jgi:hypothetical protein
MGYYIKFTRLSMKYFLILWVCSAINGSCIVPPISIPETFNSHNECVSAGYAQGYNVFTAIDSIIAEQQRLFVAFNCKPETSI